MLNTAQFSAAKDIADTKAMQSLVFQSSGFKDFKDKASEITNITNDQWLRVEMDVCKRNAVMGEGWRKMEDTKDLYPYWAYITENDGNVRPEHAALEGLVFRIGDPEGDSVHPVCDWNCRCHSEPVDDQYLKEENKQVSKGSDYLEKDDPETGKPYVGEDFRFNPGKQGPMPNDSSYSEVFSSANKGNAELFDLPEPKMMDIATKFDELKKEVATRFDEISKKYETDKLSRDKYKPGTLEKTEVFQKLESNYFGTKKYMERISEMSSKNIDENFEMIKKFTKFNGNQVDLWGDGNVLASEISQKEGKLTSTILTKDSYLQRTFDMKSKTVSMDEFFLNPLIKSGSGKGSEIFNNQVDQFSKLGFKKLVTEAGDAVGMNGYYTWARLGYDIKDKNELSIFKSLMKNSADKDLKSVTSLQQLMSTKKGRDFWRKNGSYFHGEFDLSKESNSMKILKQYMKLKK